MSTLHQVDMCLAAPVTPSTMMILRTSSREGRLPSGGSLRPGFSIRGIIRSGKDPTFKKVSIFRKTFYFPRAFKNSSSLLFFAPPPHSSSSLLLPTPPLRSSSPLLLFTPPLNSSFVGLLRSRPRTSSSHHPTLAITSTKVKYFKGPAPGHL